MIRTAVLWALRVASTSPAAAQQMAVTIDDLPAHQQRPPGVTDLQIAQQILGTLAREQLPPVYGFINGARIAERDPSNSVLLEWRAAGQPLGNHTWAHVDIDRQTAAQFEAAVVANEPLLQPLMAGEDWHWLRYPYLHAGDTRAKRRAVRHWLGAHGYRIAEVSMDFEDTLWDAPYARCLARQDPVGLKRVHDSYLAAAGAFYAAYHEMSWQLYGRDVKYVLLLHVSAVDAHRLPELLAFYRSKGVHFIGLGDALSDPAYGDDPDVGDPNGGTLLEMMTQKKRLPSRQSRSLAMNSIACAAEHVGRSPR